MSSIMNGSSADINDVIEGSLLFDINGDIVVLDTFVNILKRIELIKTRPLCLKFISYGQIYDVVCWERELGLILSAATELCCVKSVEVNRSPLWQMGVRDGDIIVSIKDEEYGHLQLKDISYQRVMGRLRDSSTDVLIEFIGPRDCSDNPSKRPFPPAHESLKQHYRNAIPNALLIRYAAVFQIDHEPENKLTYDKDLFLHRYHPLDILQATSIYLNIMNSRRPYSLRHVRTGLLSLSDEEISTFLIQVLELHTFVDVIIILSSLFNC